MSAPCLVPTSNFQLVDFQGLCLAVNDTLGSVFADVVTTTCAITPGQMWSFTPVNHGSILISALTQILPQGEVVILDEGANGQALTNNSTSFGFNITCVPGHATSVTLVDNLVGTEITLTSSEAQGNAAKVSFETLSGSASQVWNVRDDLD